MVHITADLAIIGSGSGNTLITDDESVVIADKAGHFGGTCLNVGCIPTKMFVRTSMVARSQRSVGGTPGGAAGSETGARTASR